MAFYRTSQDAARAVIYLRCYPYDMWRMEPHRKALAHLAGLLGHPEAPVYLDNGYRSGVKLPALEQVITLAGAGACRLLLVPGPFVFSIYEREARSITRRITAAGCNVVQLP